MTDRDLLRHIGRSAGQKAGYKQLVRELGLGGGGERRELLEQLERMTLRGELAKVDREHWAIPAKGSLSALMLGVRDARQSGCWPPGSASGWIRICAAQSSARPSSTGDDDIFIPPNEINGAMQGDQVLVEVGPPKRDGRREGRIARVLERRNPTVVGIFHYARKGRRGAYIPGEYRGNMVTPFDSRMTQPS
jgi:ribonuclease R